MPDPPEQKHAKPKAFREMLLSYLAGDAWEIVRKVDRRSCFWIARIVQTGSVLHPILGGSVDELAMVLHGALGEDFFDIPASATDRADDILKVAGLTTGERYNLLKSAAAQKVGRARAAKRAGPKAPKKKRGP